MRSELHRVGGDSEVSVGVNARVGLVDQVERDALRRWERQRRRIELRVKASYRNHEVGVVAVGEQQAHLAGKRNEKDVRIEQRCEEVEALLVEFERACEVDLQHQDRHVVGGQRHTQDAQNGGVARRNLDDDAERKADQRGLSPADLGHGADEEGAFLRREDGAQVADDARSIRDHILREHDALDGAGADAVHQRLEEHGAVQAEQSAHGQQGESETELDARTEICGQDNEQREALGAVGHFGGDEADGSDREEVGNLQLQSARVLSACGIDVEIAAAGDHTCVDTEANAFWRFEGECGSDRTEIASGLREGEIDGETDVLDNSLQRTEIALQRCSQRDRDLCRCRARLKWWPTESRWGRAKCARESRSPVQPSR